MGELDRVLEAVMREKEAIIKAEAEIGEREELIESLRIQKRNRIIEEIREEYKEELIQEVNEKAEKESERRKIEDLRGLMWSGFLLAFIVGLAVNQMTDIIGYYKGTVTLEKIWPTMLITAILCLVCLGAYLYSFFQKVISIYDDWKKKH